MPTLYLIQPGVRAHLRGQHLEIEPSQDEGRLSPPRKLPLHDVERIVVEERATLSTAALCEAVRRGLPVLLLSAHSGRVLGQAQATSNHVEARLAHYRRTLDPEFAVAIAATVVEAKIANSRRVLQRLAGNRDLPPDPSLVALEHDRRACLTARNLDSLRGHEGTAAGRYFDALAGFFPPSAPFERRSRRPPHNAANALLSFAYTLLVGEAEAALHQAGLDPALGFLHSPEDRRPSLALDLVEPFRAPVGDALALDLLSHSILKSQDHFDHHNGGVYLNQEGRRKFYLAYERRMEREFTSEALGQRTSLRGELTRMARSLRSAILNSEPFEPFIMN